MKTVRNAADRLGVSKSRVHFFIAKGRLRATQTDAGDWLVTDRELERFAKIPRKAGKPIKKLSKSH